MTKRTLLCCIGIASLFLPVSLMAQKDAASLEGRVVDGRGAVVAQASVTAINVDTSLTYRAESNSNGEWAISPVRIGSYRIQITAKGFKSSIEGPLTLDVQQRQRVDVTLEPGEVTENVEVRATSPLIQTDSSELGQVVDSQTMVGIPLNGRNPVQLAQLTVGVTVSEPGARDATGFGFSASGSRSLDNNFLLDGIDNNSNLPDLLNEANYVVMPPPDALQEFKIETGNYDAEFGRATGAIVNATTRSGSNQFHGVLYEFLRNQKLDANNYFNKASQPYHQNQFGATLGGRIIRDKLFFFVDYEGLRNSQATPTTALVPTAGTEERRFLQPIRSHRTHRHAGLQWSADLPGRVVRYHAHADIHRESVRFLRRSIWLCQWLSQQRHSRFSHRLFGKDADQSISRSQCNRPRLQLPLQPGAVSNGQPGRCARGSDFLRQGLRVLPV